MNTYVVIGIGVFLGFFIMSWRAFHIHHPYYREINATLADYVIRGIISLVFGIVASLITLVRLVIIPYRIWKTMQETEK